MALIYISMFLAPKLVLALFVFGLASCLASPWQGQSRRRQRFGLTVLAIGAFLGFSFSDSKVDFLLNFALYGGLWALIFAAFIRIFRGLQRSQTRGKPGLSAWAATALVCAGLIMLSYQPYFKSASLQPTDIRQHDTVTLSLLPGPWPIFGETGLYLDNPPGSSLDSADYQSANWSGNLILSSGVHVGSTDIPFEFYESTGLYSLRLNVAPTFWEEHTGHQPQYAPNLLQITVRDSDGSIGKQAARLALLQATKQRLDADYLPVIDTGDWHDTGIIEREGQWCLDYALEGMLKLAGQACIDPAGVDGQGGGFNIADAHSLQTAPAAGPLAADIERVRQSMPRALQLWLAQHPQHSGEWQLNYFASDQRDQINWVRYLPDVDEWELFLGIQKPAGKGLDVNHLNYRLLRDGSIEWRNE